MEYFVVGKDKKIYHKKTKKLIVDTTKVVDFKEGLNGFLLIREKSASHYNLAFDQRGEQLPYTGSKNIHIILCNKTYEVYPIPRQEALDGSFIKKEYLYPYVETANFSIYQEKGLYSFYHHGKCFETNGENYKLLSLNSRPYIAVKKDGLWSLYNYKGIPDPVIQNVSQIYSSIATPDSFLIGVGQRPIEPEQAKKDNLIFNLKLIGIFALLFAGTSGIAYHNAQEINKSQIEQKILTPQPKNPTPVLKKKPTLNKSLNSLEREN